MPAATVFLQPKNNAFSTAAGAIDGASNPVTFSVAAGEGALFPATASGPFMVTIDNEILKCTSRAIDALTCARAQEGTSITAHLIGAAVQLRITAKQITDLQAALNVVENEAPALVRKTANETVNNSTALQNDDHLLRALAVNSVWAFDFFLLYTSSAVADIQFDLTGPAASTIYAMAIRLDAADALQVNLEPGAGPFIGGGAGATVRAIRITGVIINGANAGNLQLRWAQNSLEVSDTIVLANSYLIAHSIVP